ncbi:MAG: DNA-3-methyladenine glycosylase family protein [Candidatus Hodarchaeota archaeon]
MRIVQGPIAILFLDQTGFRAMRTIRVKDFSLYDTMECGQTFSWVKEGEGYVNSDIGQVVYVEQRGNRILYETSHHGVDLEELFRLKDPLSEIHTEICKDGIMRDSIEFSPGLRIVKDPFYPCLVSFICSIWKNIPSIRSLTQNLRQKFGPKYEFRGKTYYGFPSPERMALVSISQLRELGFGFRAEFVHKTSESLVAEDVDSKILSKSQYLDAHKSLRSLHGVGNKVADCVCLFSLGHLEAFPIDVWIERCIQKHYGIFSAAGSSYTKKSQAARDYFGKYAGYAQEYLYYYIRSEKKKPT